MIMYYLQTGDNLQTNLCLLWMWCLVEMW